MTTQTILLTPRKDNVKRFIQLHPMAVSSESEIRASFPNAGRDTLWIFDSESMTSKWLKSINWPTKQRGEAVLLHKPNIDSFTALRACFHRIAFGSKGSFLPSKELAEALAARNRQDLFIGGTVDPDSETVTLWRGNLHPIVVPLSAFPPSGDGIAPVFDDFAVTDYGHTIKFGSYEAASDAILYEYDPEFRRRKAKERIKSEQTLGASIRRLRKQRGLGREEFSPLAAKTLARIEQNKVKSVHAKTLKIIARVLGVKPEQIESY